MTRSPATCRPADVPDGETVVPVHAVRPEGLDAIRAGLTEVQSAFAEANGFAAEPGQIVMLPGETGKVAGVLLGCGPADADHDREIRMGHLASRLTGGHYRLASAPSDWTDRLAAIGWGLGTYRFTRYLKETPDVPVLVLDGDLDARAVRDAVEATALGRDLINTPAGDMGPEALHAAAQDLADAHGATLSAVIGTELLDRNYPMIHAVGRAAHEDPRLVELEWGDPDHPRLAVVGKGITFDTGGVNMKGASGARLMKKDMGGAAHALALSAMIMAARLPIRLHCLLAIAENAVSANAYRPGDILPSRAGLSVEIDNTDAEGRLVLGDALAKATESDPVLMIDFATLTGAARVALGPQLPPFFTNRPHLHDPVSRHCLGERDPVWPMPLWQPYHSMLRSPIADMKNSGGSFAGAVTAALFLEKFADDRPWMHFDVYGWNPTVRPGHPKGADIYAVRGLFAWLASGGLNTPMEQPDTR
ncbi:M17 family metallopeptidase [uncultured Algimonas sp.]|uniref:leucyl aminopeptidase family protein n=1 Tax=uncultured Algimonas sp. TaxID=1547920 RepID=UPI002639B9A4|nr:leucyl aminopeptidase family protein [uncultured Algimonas sp.]